MNKRKQLIEQLKEVFSSHPSTTKITLYGSDVHGNVDDYSDIDIIVYNNDLEALTKSHLTLLERIGPVRNKFYFVVPSPVQNDISPIVWIEGYSPFHRIDLAIISENYERPNGFPGPEKVIYEDQSKRTGPNLADITVSFDTDYHLSQVANLSVGFAKSMKRQNYDSYRYWDTLNFRYLPALIKERSEGLQDSKFKFLTKAETKTLLKRPSIKEFYTHIPLNETTEFSLSKSFIQGYELVTDLFAKRGEKLEEKFDQEVAEFYKDFLKKELTV